MSIISDVWKKKEFIYKLDNKYYILGKNICEECDNTEILELYNHFLDVCNISFFNENYLDFPLYYKKDIADSFIPLLNACSCNEPKWNENSLALRDRLDERYYDEIELQIDRWIIASRCADFIRHYYGEDKE